MKDSTKRTINIATGVIKITNILILGEIPARLTPGINGKYKMNQIKLFRTGMLWKFTPFGNKEYLEKKVTILEKKDDALGEIVFIKEGYRNELPKEERERRIIQEKARVAELDKEEKQLKKTRK